MKTVAIISEKGGVGKTTLSINLGVAAALKNKVVAIIDFWTLDKKKIVRKCDWQTKN